MGKMLVWDITDKCNLRCEHCYNANMYFNSKVEELTLKEKLNVIDNISKNGFDTVSLLGGEPLLCPDVKEVILECGRKNIDVNITSNGIFLDEDMSKFLIENNVNSIGISLEGPTPEINDTIRGQGSFNTVYNNIKNLVKHINNYNSNLKLGIVSTLTNKNCNELIKMPELANTLGVDFINFTAFVASGNGLKNKDELECDYNKIQDKIEYIAQNEFYKYPNLDIYFDLRPYLTNYLRRKYNLRNLKWTEGFTGCFAGRKMFYLTANGNIHPCNVMINQNIPQNFDKNLIPVSDINIKSQTNWDNIKDNTYISSFNNFNKAPINLKTCLKCDISSKCSPCKIHHFDKDIVVECEYIMKKELEFHKTLKNLIPKLCKNIEVEFLKNKNLLWNPLSGNTEILNKLNTNIIKSIIEGLSIDSIIKLNVDSNIKDFKKYTYSYLLDLRLKGFLDF